MQWSSLLMLLWLVVICEIAHFGYNGAAICILIHWYIYIYFFFWLILVTAIRGRPKPKLRFLPGRLRWTLLLRQFTQWLWIEHPTFQLGGGHFTTELTPPQLVSFCAHTKVISHFILYVRPESEKHFLDVTVAFLSRRRALVCKDWASLVLTTQYTVHTFLSSGYAKTLFRNSHPSSITNIRTPASV